MREDRSALDFLDADYTFLNERLAKHYGIQGVRGSYFRKVALSSPERGGHPDAGQHPDGDVVPDADLAGDSRQVDSGERAGRAAASAAAGCAAVRREVGAARRRTCGSSWRSIARTRAARAAIRGWIRWASRWRITIRRASSARATAAGDRRFRARCRTAQMVRGPGDLKKVHDGAARPVRRNSGERLLTYSLGRGLDYYDVPAVRQIRRERGEERLPVFFPGDVALWTAYHSR